MVEVGLKLLCMTERDENMSNTHRWLAVGLALLLALTIAPAALADESTPLGATPLLGNLAGNPWAGAADLYQVAYPGGNAVVTIRVRSLLPDAVTNESFGFNLYRPYASALNAPWAGKATYRELDYRSMNAAVLTVQVYNYSRRTIPYEIVVLGLGNDAAAPNLTAVVPAPPEPATVEAGQLETGETVYSASLLGDSAGRFAEYRFSAVKGESLTITLDHQPIDPSFGRAVSFRVYGLLGKLVGKGTEMSPHHWEDKFVAPYSGEYVLQVQNYAPGLTLSYTLTIDK